MSPLAQPPADTLSPRAAYHLRRASRLTLHLKRAEDAAEQARLRLAISHHKAKAKELSR